MRKRGKPRRSACSAAWRRQTGTALNDAPSLLRPITAQASGTARDAPGEPFFPVVVPYMPHSPARRNQTPRCVVACNAAAPITVPHYSAKRSAERSLARGACAACRDARRREGCAGAKRHARQSSAWPERSEARSSPTRSEAQGHAQQAPIGQTRNDERHNSYNKRRYRAADKEGMSTRQWVNQLRASISVLAGIGVCMSREVSARLGSRFPTGGRRDGAAFALQKA